MIQVSLKTTRDRSEFENEVENLAFIQESISLTFLSYLAQKISQDDMICPDFPNDFLTHLEQNSEFCLEGISRQRMIEEENIFYLLILTSFKESQGKITTLYQKYLYLKAIVNDIILYEQRPIEYFKLSRIDQERVEKSFSTILSNRQAEEADYLLPTNLEETGELSRTEKSNMQWIQQIVCLFGVHVGFFSGEDIQKKEGFYRKSERCIYLKRSKLSEERLMLLTTAIHELAHVLEYVYEEDLFKNLKSQNRISCQYLYTHQSQGRFSHYYKEVTMKVLLFLLDKKCLSAQEVGFIISRLKSAEQNLENEKENQLKGKIESHKESVVKLNDGQRKRVLEEVEAFLPTKLLKLELLELCERISA